MTRVPIATNEILNQSTTTTTVTNGNRRTITEVTTVDRDGGSFITDVQIIPKMRKLAIEFVGHGLRPRREHFFYFDDKLMSQFVQRTNIIKLDTEQTSSFPNFMNPSPAELSIVGGYAKILLAETDSDGNTILYVTQVKQAKSNVTVGNTVSVTVSTGIDTVTNTVVAIGNVTSYIHQSGVARANSNTSTIYMSLDADATTEDLYVGNVITIVTGSSAGQSSNIVSYNASTRMATVSPVFTSLSANSIYSIGDYRSLFVENGMQAHYSTGGGYVTGVLHIPDPNSNTTYSFYTGDRIFRALDNGINDTDDYTSRADYRFTSNGLRVDTAQVIDRTIITNTTIITTSTVYQNPTLNIRRWVYDPIAQSFFVDENDYPEGVFISSVDLFFKNKGDYLGVELQIRPMVNGLPSSTEVLPYASVFLEPKDVTVSDNPNVSNTLTSTKFTFPSPVFLNSNQEYALVLITNDYGYDIFVSELGQREIGTGRIVSDQPYIGSFFKSQNGSTFTPLQDEDLMFRINKCRFVSSGTVQFNEYKEDTIEIPDYLEFDSYDSNAAFDVFEVHSDAVEIPGTKLTYNYRATTNSSLSLDSSYTTFKPDTMVVPNERKIVLGPDQDTKSFYVQVQMSTTNPDVSPVIMHNRQSVLPHNILINNMGITNSIITIANTGSGYTAQNTSLTFSGLTGFGANGYITANATTGGIESVIIDSEGSGYFDNVVCTISSTDGTGGVILVSGETDQSGGPALARYISKSVTLIEGLSAGDLRVYLTASKPREAEIAVYYKVRNELDPESIDNKYWNKMVQVGDQFVYSDPQILNGIEYEYRPSLTSNNITYTTDAATYKTFNEYKIKVVLASSSTNPLRIPSLFDVSAIALPADVF